MLHGLIKININNNVALFDGGTLILLCSCVKNVRNLKEYVRVKSTRYEIPITI